MKRVFGLFWFCILVMVPFLSAQTFQLPLNSDRLTSGNALIELPDSSLVFSSFFQSSAGPIGNGSLNVTRISEDDGLIWSKDYFYQQTGNRSTVRYWPSENALLLGSTLTSGSPYKIISRLDLDGNVVWSRRYGSLTDFNNINLGLIDVVPDDNGTAVLAGGVQDLANTNGANDLYVARIGANGDIIWANNYCFSCLGIDAIFSDILETQDGGYLVTGGVNGTTINAGDTYLLLMKIDANGNLEWCNQYLSTAVTFAFTQVGRETVQLPNGHFVVAGFLDNFASSIRDGLLLEVNTNGQFERAVQVNIATSDHEVTFNNLFALDNNTLVVPGSSEEDVNISLSEVNNFLLQIQLDGTIDWSYNYFQEELLGFSTPRNDLIQRQDNRIAYLANDHTGFDDLYPVLIVTDAEGRTGCEDPIPLTANPNVTYQVSSLLPEVQSNFEVEDYPATVSNYTGYTFEIPTLDLGPDTLFCQDFNLLLDASINAPATYSWNTGQTSPSVNVSDPGLYIVTVSAAAPCIQLTDTVIIDSQLGSTQVLDTTLCQGQSIVIGGTIYDSTGEYTAFIPGPECDTLVDLSLTVIIIESNLDTLICPNSSLTIGGQIYTDPGTYIQTFPNSNGCDSTVFINLDFYSSGEDMIQSGTVNCTDETVVLSVETGNSWQWSTGDSGNSIIAPAPGTYSVSFLDNNGCQIEDTLELPNIDGNILELDLVEQSNYTGFGVSCFGFMDGELTVETLNGQSPYNYQWNNGSTNNSLTGVSTGTYSVTVTDNTGCSGERSFELSSPPPIAFGVATEVSGCPGFENGSISVTDVVGGTGSFVYAVDPGLTQDSPFFTELAPGNYTVIAQDSNGCESTEDVFLPALSPPTLFIGPDTSIALGESYQIRTQTTLSDITQINWTPESNLDCTDCLEPLASPVESTIYQLTVTDGAGCTTTSSVQVLVVPDRSIFIPNAFSPNGDGNNDQFAIYPGPGVEQIQSIQIFDRWGGLMQQIENIDMGNYGAIWDGEVDGTPAGMGVYVYVIQVRYIDNVETVISGDLTLLR